jgi:hypothetical protein
MRKFIKGSTPAASTIPKIGQIRTTLRVAATVVLASKSQGVAKETVSVRELLVGAAVVMIPTPALLHMLLSSHAVAARSTCGEIQELEPLVISSLSRFPDANESVLYPVEGSFEIMGA